MMTGNILGEDPACPYKPGLWSKLVEKYRLNVEKAVSEISGLRHVLPPR